jgi:hypothetical protein
LRAQAWSARADFGSCARAACCAGDLATSNRRGGGVGDWWGAAFGIRGKAELQRGRWRESSRHQGMRHQGIEASSMEASGCEDATQRGIAARGAGLWKDGAAGVSAGAGVITLIA